MPLAVYFAMISGRNTSHAAFTFCKLVSAAAIGGDVAGGTSTMIGSIRGAGRRDAIGDRSPEADIGPTKVKRSLWARAAGFG